MYFLERARNDGKSVAGLETVRDQISLFERLSMNSQAEYLLSSLEQAHELPREVDSIGAGAWQRGDSADFETENSNRISATIRRSTNQCSPPATAVGCRRSRAFSGRTETTW